MNQTLKTIIFVVIALGLFAGVRFIGSTIHYGCHREPIVNVEGGDDCAPPIWLVGQLGFYITGGSLNPFRNYDATTVRKVSWSIEKADPTITNPDDFIFYEQKIAADITTYDGKSKRYDLGVAMGCTGTTTSELQNEGIVIGRVQCSFVESGTIFSAFKRGHGFSIERYDESAEDGSIKTTELVQI